MGESSSVCFPTLVEPDAVFLDFLFLASRDDNDALFPLLLRVAPPLNSRIFWMSKGPTVFVFAMMVLGKTNGVFAFSIAEAEEANNKHAVAPV